MSESKHTHPAPTLVAPANCEACYVEMGGRTYYLDDSTGEAIAESWKTKSGEVAEREKKQA